MSSSSSFDGGDAPPSTVSSPPCTDSYPISTELIRSSRVLVVTSDVRVFSGAGYCVDAERNLLLTSCEQFKLDLDTHHRVLHLLREVEQEFLDEGDERLRGKEYVGDRRRKAISDAGILCGVDMNRLVFVRRVRSILLIPGAHILRVFIARERNSEEELTHVESTDGSGVCRDDELEIARLLVDQATL